MFKILDFDCPEHFYYTKEALKSTERAFLEKALYLIENHMIMNIMEAENNGGTRADAVRLWDESLSKVLNGEM